MHTYSDVRDGLDSFLTHHLESLENEQRVEALLWYCQGLTLDIKAKTALGLAEKLRPDSVQGTRQRIQRAIGQGRFHADDVYQRLQETVFSSGQMQAYAIDDTGIQKKGDKSVGVARQYSGTMGKVGNCQVIVSLHGISNSFGACLNSQLYLSEEWCGDAQRRTSSGVPKEIQFQKKWQIALDMIEAALLNGGPHCPVLADAGYGDSRAFRERLRERKLHYAVGISGGRCVWRSGTILEIPPSTNKQGRPFHNYHAQDDSKPVRVEVLAEEFDEKNEFQEIKWRKGSQGFLKGHFAACRIQSAERRTKGEPPGDEEWLVIEKLKKGYKYYLASLPKSASITMLVRLIKTKWHIERDYQDMKQNLGFDKYEGRSWGGLHRHLAMVSLMHAFIALHMEDFSPERQTAKVDME